ncbi:MAG TPA: hypothetical protein VHA75_11390 [Rugosimonospora sp.]|nr:hypothetical protein [Rugosimonospora sp.]
MADLTLGEWADELGRAAADTIREVRPVVSRGALNVKRDWARGYKRLGPHITDLPRTISYDLDQDAVSVGAEVGPDKALAGTQAPLGNVIEFGSPTSAPHPAGAAALEAEAPRFATNVLDVGERLLSR